MTVDVALIWQFIREFGLTVTILVGIIYTGIKGWWVFPRELVSQQAHHAAEMKLMTERLADEKAERIKAEARAAQWEKIAWEGVQTLKIAAEKATHTP